MTRRLRVGRHRHYLGTWDPATRLRIARGNDWQGLEWRAPTEHEIVELGAQEPVADDDLANPGAGDAARAIVAAMTVPARVRRELWELGWDDEATTLAPRDQEAFAAYGRRVVAFFRAAGVPLGGPVSLGDTPKPPERPCETRLHALAPGTSPIAGESAGLVALVNVGESECHVAMRGAEPDGALSVRIPPDEGCLLSRAAWPYHIVVPGDAEYGLLLQLA